jgi:hypothetical protein
MSVDVSDITPATCFALDCYGTRVFESAGLVVALIVGATLSRWYYALPVGLAIAVAVPLTAIAARAIFFGDVMRWLPAAYPAEYQAFWLQQGFAVAFLAAATLAAYGVRRLVTRFGDQASLQQALISIGSALFIVASAAVIAQTSSEIGDAFARASDFRLISGESITGENTIDAIYVPVALNQALVQFGVAIIVQMVIVAAACMAARRAFSAA